VLVIGGILLSGGKHPAKTTGSTPTSAAAGDPVGEARAAITAALPAMDCAWLDIGKLDGDASGVTVSVKGVARDTLAVQKVISDAVASKGLTLKGLDTNDVAPLSQQNACPMLNAYASIKSADTSALTSPQVKYEMAIPANGSSAKPIAKPIIDFAVPAGTPDLVLYGLQPTGEGQVLVENLAQLSDKQFLATYGITSHGNGRYEMNLQQDETGWAGILVITGKAPFDGSLILPPPSNRGTAWRQSFDKAAAARGWKAEMIWIDTVDDVPNG
jgi:serine/threonine-protein kinase